MPFDLHLLVADGLADAFLYLAACLIGHSLNLVVRAAMSRSS